MKKNDLIKLLQEQPGNPDIVLWNGYVGDYMDISNEFIELELVKETVDFHYNWAVSQWKQDHKLFEVPEDVLVNLRSEAEARVKKRQWELPNSFVGDEDMESWYGKKRKKVLMLNPKLRGKKSYGMSSGDDLEY